jgi:hypothetical protein
MNIHQIIRQAKLIPVGKSVSITIHYPHNRITGYDSHGRAIRDEVMRYQTFYGCNRKQVEHNAILYLKCEKWEAQRQMASRPSVIIREYART